MCLHGKSRNPNESVSSVMRARLPKTEFVGNKTLRFSVYDSMTTFHCYGQVIKCVVFQKLGMSTGQIIVNGMKDMYKARLQDSTRATVELKRKKKSRRKDRLRGSWRIVKKSSGVLKSRQPKLWSGMF